MALDETVISSIGSLVQDTLIKTASAGSLIQDTNLVSGDIDSKIQDTLTVESDLGSMVLDTNTKSLDTDGLLQTSFTGDLGVDGLVILEDQTHSTDLDAVLATASITGLDAIIRSRYAILKIHEMSSLDVGINKTDGGDLVYRGADNTLETDADPIQIPEPGDLGYSYTKTLRPYLLAAPGVSVLSNIRWYSSGVNGFGQGINVVVKNLGVTWTENVNGPFPGTFPLFNYVPSNPINGDSVDTGPFNNSDEGTYVGDLIRLQMVVDSSAQPGHTPIEYLTLAYDES